MGAKGAGNPIGFMGALSDTLNLIYLRKYKIMTPLSGIMHMYITILDKKKLECS